MTKMKENLRSFYENSMIYRDLLKSSTRYHRETELDQYVSIVKKYAMKDGYILDLGCGTGETTHKLALKGLRVVGVDISIFLLKTDKHAFSEKRMCPGYVVSDITRLPVRDHSVGCVALLNVIEHIPEVNDLLDEVLRVLDSNGRVIIVSPNLISPLRPVRHLLGIEGFNTQFYGSHARAAYAVFSNLILISRKLLFRQPEFVFRSPILEDFQCPDDDAVYLANFIDLRKWFRRKGYSVSYRQFLPRNDSFLGRIKSLALNRISWLDKGFCLIAELPE
jgi:ubiquinone/menaquinone biosynthesis C-methylase UbiE